MDFPLSKKCAVEFIGTAFLLATIIGSGIMAEQLSGENVAIALLGNTIPTGAILFVLITIFAPVSGAHFNPAVTLVFWIEGEISLRNSGLYIIAQVIGAVLGVWIAHLMFDMEVLQFSQKNRSGISLWFSEGIATFGLIMTILLTVKTRKNQVAMTVGLYITAAYWFTASTSFANPAVTIARSLSDSFAGIRPDDLIGFIVSQLLFALLAWLFYHWLYHKSPQ